MSRRKQARPIRHLEECSDDDENCARDRAARVKLDRPPKVPQDKVISEQSDDEERTRACKRTKHRKFPAKLFKQDTEVKNGLLLPRVRGREGNRGLHNNSRKKYSSSDEEQEIQEAIIELQEIDRPVSNIVALDRTNVFMNDHDTRKNAHKKKHHVHARKKLRSNDEIDTDKKITRDEPDELVDEDANNNDRTVLDDDKELTESEQHAALKESMTAAIQNLIGSWPTSLPVSEDAIPAVTLEALQNTKVAMAQFASNALSAVSSNDPEKTSIQDLALLQSTLITLQQQQLLQLQLIQQLQHPEPPSGSPKEATPPKKPAPQAQVQKPSKVERKEQGSVKTQDEGEKKHNMSSLSPHFASLLNCGNQDPNRPLSPGLPCSFEHDSGAHHKNEHDPMAMMSNMMIPPPPPVNNLEVLQKRAQEVLDSASQGLLASSLAADDPRKKGLGYDKSREPFFKHRCRYCGKVFGSDSALQIHIRSHTGERPFKCNVCGSRFTTKGNLKVHFQRHAAKFPHIKMNPHPVPEHLDHFHPPLLAAGQTSPPDLSPLGPPPPPPSLPPNSNSSNPPPSYFSSALFHSPSMVHHHQPLFRFDMISKGEEQPEEMPKPIINTPQDLSKKKESEQPEHPRNDALSLESEKQSSGQNPTQAELVRCMMMMMRDKPNKVNNPVKDNEHFSEDGQDENENETDHEIQAVHTMDHDYDDDQEHDLLNDQIDDSQDQPENLSNAITYRCRSTDTMLHEHTIKSLPDRPLSAHTFLTGVHRNPDHSKEHRSASTHSSPGGSCKKDRNNLDITKDPAIYTNLLPRPGSNDNAWESLIEVTKTSETSKLQQLVDNIEHKLTDPNQCIICHRVLSCKSALQMHYRTHTGERPFKCKICGRAFTTKGNLKTHMGVHRAKPPLRVLHQCPVCHKRFTNSLVLQQHIRLHTGEPTDLTPDQIRAAEVKDGFLPYGGGSPHGFPPGMMPHSSSQLGYFSSEHGYGKEDVDVSIDSDTELSDDSKSVSSNSNVRFSTSLAALENQVKTITTLANSNMLMMMGNNVPEDLTSKRNYNEEDQEEQETSNHSSEWKNEKHDTPSPVEKTPLDLTPKNTHTPPPPMGPHFPFNAGMLGSPFHNPPFPLGFNPAVLIPPPPPPGSAAAVAAAMGPRLGDASCFLWGSAGPGAMARGNTTCSICLKTFACHSALEIHYRSHTKERPFKCTVCDRGFSTKGNMKQHMLTHKIRDMPSGQASSTSSHHHHDHSSCSSSGMVNEVKNSDDDDSNEFQFKKASSPDTQSHDEETETPAKKHPRVDDTDDDSYQSVQYSSAAPRSNEAASSVSPPSNAGDNSLKHVCKVCTKNFSSTSALQIHMRTHTGDRPFVCSVCQKAFTTKGNLKVHMGTHMWTNGASRRGRRMSLEMPLGLGAGAPGSFFHPLISQSFLRPHKEGESSSRALLYAQALGPAHHQTLPYGPSHNQTSQQTSPLLFLNGTLQKQADLVQGFSAPASPNPKSSKPSSSTAADKQESPADRNASQSPNDDAPKLPENDDKQENEHQVFDKNQQIKHES